MGMRTPSCDCRVTSLMPMPARPAGRTSVASSCQPCAAASSMSRAFTASTGTVCRSANRNDRTAKSAYSARRCQTLSLYAMVPPSRLQLVGGDDDGDVDRVGIVVARADGEAPDLHDARAALQLLEQVREARQVELREAHLHGVLDDLLAGARGALARPQVVDLDAEA